MRSLLVIAALVWSPFYVLAQGDQDLPPTTCLDCASWTGAVTDVDEDPDGGGDNAIQTTTTNNDDWRVGFDPPSSNPDTGTDAQAFELLISKCTNATPGVEDAGGSDPTVDVEVYCNGSQDQVLAEAVVITGDDQSVRQVWTFSTANCSSDGSDVELLVQVHRAGGGGNRRYPCIEASEWEVTHAAAGPSPTIIVVE